MGQAPPSGGVTLRSFNRNFSGRTGTRDANTYLAGVEVCVASALAGEITDPRESRAPRPAVQIPEKFLVDDSMILPPAKEPDDVHIIRGPNIVPLPSRGALADTIRGQVLLAAGDNITTDDIMPAGAQILPLRSNIPAISKYVFSASIRSSRAAPSRPAVDSSSAGRITVRDRVANTRRWRRWRWA